MKILVVRLDHLGDLLLTTPLIRALGSAGHATDVLVQDALKCLFRNSPFVSGVYGVGEIEPRYPNHWVSLGLWMRRSRYDAVILAYGRERKLCFASVLSGAPRRIAMWSGIWGRLTLHDCLPSRILDCPRPVSEILLACSRALGAPDQGLKPDLFLTEEEMNAARAELPENLRERPLIGLHPGSAGNACNLPGEVYGELAQLLLTQTDCGLVITGTQVEKALLQKWPKDVLSSDRLWVSMGKLGLRELAGSIAEMRVFVCSSTGPLHIASAVGTSTVSPFCPTPPLNAAIWGNMGAPSRVVEPQTCPRRNGSTACCDFRGEITARRMLEEVLELLAATSSSK